ncbi:MAG: 2-dehydro-3-deoxygalactonokinase [Proteobacteria bacterium]|nr:2-dehydro-3-deoxygalactonokinase [Pseudomonadota bacterium]
MALNHVAWIAVDWGTSAMRAWAMGGDDRILAEASSAEGMGTLEPSGFEPALIRLISDWLPADGVVPVFACGMVGARQGWREAQYRNVPCPPLGPEVTRITPEDRRFTVTILPGLAQKRPADVMRGEETQIAGYQAQRPDFDGVIALPGTHTKWAYVSAGEVVSFQTCMTGEMFALLADRSVLRHSVQAETFDLDAFRAAVADTLSDPQKLAARLFGIRAETLLSGLQPASARARLSGLLIGLELAATRPYWLGQDVVLIGAPRLSGLYREALAAQGVAAEVEDVTAMTLGGLAAARRGEHAE